MKFLIKANKYTFLTIWIISLFWILLLLQKKNIIDYFRFTIFFISLSGIILDYFYSKKWEEKFNISKKILVIGNITLHIIPFIYILFTKPIKHVNYLTQILIAIFIIGLYSLIVNPFDQYM